MAAAFAILSALAAHSAEIPITYLPYTISGPGTYVFKSNLYYAAPFLSSSSPLSYAITVNAPGPVIIEMRGFTMSAPPESSNVNGAIIPCAIDILSSNVTVRNGSI